MLELICSCFLLLNHSPFLCPEDPCVQHSPVDSPHAEAFGEDLCFFDEKPSCN